LVSRALDEVVLTPVPLVHLVNGEEICRRQGQVAFGSNAWEVMRRIEAGMAVLIYASHSAEALGPVVTWTAVFDEYVEAGGSASLRRIRRFRPPSADGEEADWAGYYLVHGLRRLAEPLPIDGLRKLDGSRFSRRFVPEGPIIASLIGGPASLG
jgi:hypothetical protein